VLGLAPSGAVLSAAAQLGIERIQDASIDLTNLEVAQERRDVVAHVAPVEGERVRCAVELVEVALQQLVHRRLSPRAPPLGDLVEQALAGRLGRSFRRGPRLHGLRESRRPDSESIPAYTFTRSAPLGSVSMLPSARRLPAAEPSAMAKNVSRSHHV
jgi:hypothetical protein